MTDLTPEQLATIRKERKRLGPKELARKLKLPKKKVERAIEKLEEAGDIHEPVWWRVGALVLVLVCGLLAYSGNTQSGFHFDDNHTIQGNRAIRTLKELSDERTRADDGALRRFRNFRRSLLPAAKDLYESNPYRMVTLWTFTANYYWHGLNAETPNPQDPLINAPHAGWHKTNNAIHLLNGLLVFWVAWLTLTAPVFRVSTSRTSLPTLVALLTAVVFVSHPMQTQAVTYLTQRAESLCATFYLLSLGCYIMARRHSLGEKRGEAPWATPLILGVAFLAASLLAVMAAKTDLVGARAFLGGAGLLFAAAVAGVVALVVTGRDTRAHALWSVGAFVCFGLGLESKELAATIPFAIVVWELLFVPGQGGRGRTWLQRAISGLDRERLRYFGGWLAVLVAIFILGYFFMGHQISKAIVAAEVREGGRMQGSFSFPEYFLTSANVMQTYMRMFVIPVGLNLDHDYPKALVDTGATITAMISVLVILAGLGLSLWAGGRGRVAAFAILVGLAVLAPTQSVIVLPDVIFEHRFYLPLALAALVAAVVAERIVRRFVADPEKRPLVLGALVLLACVVLVPSTRARNEIWATELTMWRDITEKSPNKPRAWTNLGLAYQEREPHRVTVTGPQGTAILWGQARPLPGDLVIVQPTGRTTLGRPTVLAKKDIVGIQVFPGSDQEARAAYERALKLDPQYFKALNNLGLISAYQHHNRVGELLEIRNALIPLCIRQGNRALQQQLEARMVQAERERQELFKTAERCLEETYRLQKSLVACNNLGNLYSDAGHFEKAIEWIDRASTQEGVPAEIWATSGDTRYQQGLVLWHEGRHDDAKKAWTDARRRYNEYLARAPKGPFKKHVGERRVTVDEYLDGSKTPGGGRGSEIPPGHSPDDGHNH